MYTVRCHVKCAFIYFYIVSYFILTYLRCLYVCTLYCILFFGNGGRGTAMTAVAPYKDRSSTSITAVPPQYNRRAIAKI